MSARSLAQEVVSWYLAHLDPSSSNAENVQNYLRRPVLALTLKILLSDEAIGLEKSFNGLEIEEASPAAAASNTRDRSEQNGVSAVADGTGSRGFGDWREHLRRSSTLDEETESWNKKDEELYKSLERRTRARMDAFIEACALAVHCDPLNSTQKRSPSKSRSAGSKLRLPTRPTSASGRELSLTEALSGYSVPRKKKSTSGTASPTLAAIQPATEMLRQLSNSSSGQVMAYAQFRAADLTTRLELYLRCLTRVRVTKKECVAAMEPPRAVKARVNALVLAFVNTVGCVRSMSPVLTKLLKSLAKELLAVDTLGDDISNVVRQVVSEYEKQTSFASLAFLSSPEESAEKTLAPLVMTFVEYLQLNWENLVAESDLERMLSTVLDVRMRNLFKTIEFRSIGHLLEVCQDFRNELQRIELPPNVGGMECNDVTTRCMDPEAIRQAVRDLQRETITVNGHILPPVRNRKELVTLLSETLNSRTLMHEKRRTPKGKARKVSRSESCPASMSEMKSSSNDQESDFISSGNEGDTDGSLPKRRDEGTHSAKKKPKRRNFQLKTVDMMTRRLLIAASRTGMGGDAFFIVRDLFGDEDVEVVPSKSIPSYGRVARGGTIEIMVRLTSVTIKCHGSFDVYPKPVESFQEPLIQVHTTTSETIYLQEVRAGDTSGEGSPSNLDSGSDDSEIYPMRKVLVLQERKTDKTGWRTLSIRPALYEVVEEWNTPS